MALMRGAGTASTAAQHASGGCSLHFSHQQHSAHARQVQRQPSPVAAAHAARAPQRQRRRHLAVVAAAGGRDPRHKNMSRVEVFMRTTPPLNMFVDYKLLLGDVVMVLATETASDRIPLDQMPQLTASLVAAWLFAGALRGDYRMEDDPDNNNPLANAMGWPILIAIIGAAETWGCTMPPAILGYAFMVSHFWVEPTSVLTRHGEHMLGPQMEVSIALLVTMACWRGIAARLRL